MNPSELTLETVSDRNRSGPLTWMYAAAACATFTFAFWTLATHLARVSHFSFRTLSQIGPFTIAGGIACGVLSARSVRTDANQRSSPASSKKLGWIWIATAAVLVIARWVGLGYSAFWIASVLLLFSAVVRARATCGDPPEQAHALTKSQIVILLLLMFICAAMTYLAHRPDVDDAVYVGTAADAIAHPDLPVLSHDVLHGDQEFPLMLPSYAVESYELFIAMLAYWFGVQPIFLAHAIVPTLLAMLVPIAWALLMRILTPRHWVVATLVAFVVLSLPADFRGFGNFAFVRLFQGKAAFVSIGIPLLYAFAWEFEEKGSVREWLKVAACTVASVGLSSSAIFVVPMALVAAALGGWRRGFSKRAVLTFLPAIYPLACGVWVSRSFDALSGVFAHLPARAELAATMVFGAHSEHVILFALLTAPFLQRDGRLRWYLTVVVLFYFLVPLDPFTFKLLSGFTTRDAVWRVLWCVPVAGIATTVCVSAFNEATARWGRAGTTIASVLLVGVLAYLAPYSSFAPSNGVSYSLKPLKVVHPDYETARDAIAATPREGSILAPENVAVWVPTFVNRRPLISVREIYDGEMGAHLPPEEARDRRQLRELVSGKEFSELEIQRLVNSLRRYGVGLVITPSKFNAQLARELGTRGFIASSEVNGYIFYRTTLPPAP